MKTKIAICLLLIVTAGCSTIGNRPDYDITVGKELAGVWVLTRQSRSIMADIYRAHCQDKENTRSFGEVGPQTRLIVFAPFPLYSTNPTNPDYPQIGIMENFPFEGTSFPFSTVFPFRWTLNSTNASTKGYFLSSLHP